MYSISGNVNKKEQTTKKFTPINQHQFHFLDFWFDC